jgi:hypothetical protein
VISNVCLIIASFFDIFSHLGTEAVLTDIVNILLGLGTLFSWINMMRYIGVDEKYVVILGALKRAMPNITRFLVGAIPIFTGYALFGVLNFSKDTQRVGVDVSPVVNNSDHCFFSSFISLPILMRPF